MKTKRHPRNLLSGIMIPAFAGMTLIASVCFAASPLFEEANAKYRAGDFKAASATYRKIVDSGSATAAVYYNLGNASLRLGEKGDAMLYYERARKIAPRDRDILWNIQVLKNALPDRIEDRVSHPLLTPLDKLASKFTPEEAALALTIGLSVLALLAFAGLLVPSLKGSLAVLRVIFFFFTVASTALLALEWRQTKDPLAVVLDRQTTAYYGPSDRETKAFILHEGAEGRVLDETGEWIYLALRNGNTGWIRKNSCEIV